MNGALVRRNKTILGEPRKVGDVLPQEVCAQISGPSIQAMIGAGILEPIEADKGTDRLIAMVEQLVERVVALEAGTKGASSRSSKAAPSLKKPATKQRGRPRTQLKKDDA